MILISESNRAQAEKFLVAVRIYADRYCRMNGRDPVGFEVRENYCDCGRFAVISTAGLSADLDRLHAFTEGWIERERA